MIEPPWSQSRLCLVLFSVEKPHANKFWVLRKSSRIFFIKNQKICIPLAEISKMVSETVWANSVLLLRNNFVSIIPMFSCWFGQILLLFMVGAFISFRITHWKNFTGYPKICIASELHLQVASVIEKDRKPIVSCLSNLPTYAFFLTKYEFRLLLKVTACQKNFSTLPVCEWVEPHGSCIAARIFWFVIFKLKYLTCHNR